MYRVNYIILKVQAHSTIYFQQLSRTCIYTMDTVNK